MAKNKKKQPIKKEPTPIEIHRDFVIKQISCVNEELERIAKKCEGIDVAPEIEAIGDSLELIDETFKECEEDFDTVNTELDEAKESLKDAAEENTRIMEYSDGLTEYDTMLGEIKFKTNNLIDAEILDLFTTCLIQIRPIDLIEKLNNILRHKDIDAEILALL